MLKIEKTEEINPGDNLVMVVYGRAGVGKTTFGASAPNAVILDFENGTKYLGERGIKADVIRLNNWLSNEEKNELGSVIQQYDSIVVDPLGEAMDKLIDCPNIKGKKFRDSTGGLTIAGWGEVKRQMRNFIKWLRGTGKNIIIVAHVVELNTDSGLCHRIQVATKLSDEIPNMVDVISFMGVQKNGDDKMRVLFTPQQGGEFDSKDRTGRVPDFVEVSEQKGYQDFLNALAPIENKIESEPVKEEQELFDEASDIEPEEDLSGLKTTLKGLIDELIDLGITPLPKGNQQKKWANDCKKKADLEKAIAKQSSLVAETKNTNKESA